MLKIPTQVIRRHRRLKGTPLIANGTGLLDLLNRRLSGSFLSACGDGAALLYNSYILLTFSYMRVVYEHHLARRQGMKLSKGVKRTLFIGGAGAAAATVFLSPEFNDTVERLLSGGNAPTIESALNEEMTDAANGQGFDTTRFTTETGYFKTVVGARDSLLHNAAFFPGRKVTAAASCGLLAVNKLTIPDAALTRWRAADTEAAKPSSTHKAFETSHADQLYNQAAKLCLEAYPSLNPPTTPIAKEVLKPVQIINNAVS